MAERATQLVRDVILVGTSDARATQLVRDVILVGTSDARATQLVRDVIVDTFAPPVEGRAQGELIIMGAFR